MTEVDTIKILECPGTIGVNRHIAKKFVVNDAATMYSMLPYRSFPHATWFVSETVRSELELISMSNGSQVVQMGKCKLMGLPIIFMDDLPDLGGKGDVMLCDTDYFDRLPETAVVLANGWMTSPFVVLL